MLSSRCLVGGLSFISALLVSDAAGLGQCQWQALGPPGTNNAVFSLMEWDPDGAGPSPSRLLVGGVFTAAGGNSSIRQLAAFDGSSWTGFGSGFFSPGSTAAILALTTLGSGDLIAGGDFQTANGVTARFIARWTGTTWAPLGTGMDSPVRALAVTP